jgi:hypothetical protein
MFLHAARTERDYAGRKLNTCLPKIIDLARRYTSVARRLKPPLARKTNQLNPELSGELVR